MRQSHRILSNAAVMWVTQVLQVAPPLILVPYLIRTIGETNYGVYILVWSLVMSIDQLEKSLQSGVVKYSSGFLAQGRIDEVNKVVSSSSVYSFVLAVLASASMFFTAALYKDNSDQIGFALAMVGIIVLFNVPLTPYIAVIQSRQNYYVNATAGIMAQYANLIAVMIWFYIVGPSVWALIVIVAGTRFLAMLVQVPIAYRLVPGLQNRPRLCNKEHFRLIASFGATIVLASFCIAVNSTGIRWLMNSMASTCFVTHLAIMLTPVGLLSSIIQAMTITVMPAASAYQATENHTMLQELLIRGMRYSMILLISGNLAAFFLMKNVLVIWVGSDYAFLTPYALGLFAGSSFMLSTSTAHHMLKGIGKLRVVVYIYLFGFVIVPVTLILTVFQLCRNPYLAVTVGLISGHFICGCLNVALCAKAVHADLRKACIRVYVQPLIIAMFVGLTMLGTVTCIGLDGLVAMSFVSGLASLLFFGGCYAFIATNDERQQATGLIQFVINKIAFRWRKGLVS